MCFSMLYPVDNVENPDVVETFTGPADAVKTAVQLWLHNGIVQAALDEAAKFERVIETSYGVPLGELPDRTVIITNPVGQRYLEVEGNVHPEQVFVTRHTGLDNKIISLQLKDFGYLAMYNVVYNANGAELKVKFGVESESATTYNCKSQEFHYASTMD